MRLQLLAFLGRGVRSIGALTLLLGAGLVPRVVKAQDCPSCQQFAVYVAPAPGADAHPLIGASNWRFVHAPGVDDPLVGLYYLAPYFQKYFYLTDGRGRSLAFTDSVGNDQLGHVTYTQNGGNRAGAIDRSHTFANSRAETADAPGLSFYRNRYYDQTTGRWTQEDPIGIAGGVNLYQYAGNNPPTFTDPFGLEGCDPPGSCMAKWVAVGMGVGAAGGAAVAAGCTVGSGGVCLVGAPSIVYGGAALGASVGTLAGSVAENAATLAASAKELGEQIRRTVNKAIVIIGVILGAETKKPDLEKDKPPPPAPTSTKTVIPVDGDQQQRQ